MTNPCLCGEMNEHGLIAIWEVTKNCFLRCPHCCSDSAETHIVSGNSSLDRKSSLELLDILHRNNV